jgi:hypothetical protein
MTITSEDGSYTLDGITEEEKQKYAILVKAILGQTKDSDDNGSTVKYAFFLKAPASDADVVSPLTTLVQNKLENDPTLTVETAIQDVKKKLNVSEDIDITADYVARKTQTDEDSTTYANLHKVAEVVADTIGKSIQEGNIDTNSDEYADAGMVVLDELETKLSNISKKVKDNNFSVDSYVKDLNITVDTNKIEKVKEKKEVVKKIAKATKKVTDSKDFEANLRADGLYTYWFDSWNSNNSYLYKTLLKVNNENKLSWEWHGYNFDGDKFVENNYSYATSFYKGIDIIYKPSKNGWKKETLEFDNAKVNFNDDVTFESDGSMISTSKWGNYKTTVLSVMNLEGLDIKPMAGNDYFWDDEDNNIKDAQYYISKDTIFSPDALLIKTKTQQTEANVMVWGEYCYSYDE